MWAYEEDICYFVDERNPTPANLARRDAPLKPIDPFLTRYFEPMSLDRNHPDIQWALKNNKFVDPGVLHIQRHEFGRSGRMLPIDDPRRHKKRTIKTLGFWDLDNIIMKKTMLRRFFRILPQLRTSACSRLSQLGLDQEYMALSVRKGDKVLEFAVMDSMKPYIDRAEIAIKTHFDGKVPKIFVASDDCNVMEEFRTLRPDWVFVSECDNETADGFALADVKKWTEEQTDKHFEKFMAELIAMASAKYFIGVSTTNVSFWVYFMRHMDAHDDTWEFVDRGNLFPY